MAKHKAAKAKEQMSDKPNPALKRLNVLVGKWQSEGETIAEKNEPVIKINGTDSYEWFPGDYFLVHHADVSMGDEQVKVIEMIGGYDASSRTYPMRSFDNQGNFQTMQASVDEQGVWKFTGEKIRTTLVVADDGKTTTAKWERTNDGSMWQHWMDMKFTKVN